MTFYEVFILHTYLKFRLKLHALQVHSKHNAETKHQLWCLHCITTTLQYFLFQQMVSNKLGNANRF